MKVLIDATNPIAGADSIIVYEGVGKDGYLIYPVEINGNMMEFHLDKDGFWKPVDAAQSVPVIICWCVADMIKQAER